MTFSADYTDPSTVDVDTVIGNINSEFRQRGHRWTDRLSWPHVTVKALADKVEQVRSRLRWSNAYVAELEKFVSKSTADECVAEANRATDEAGNR